MKKLVPFLLSMNLALQSLAQATNTPLTKEEYLAKSSNQKTTAWVLAGGGLGIAITGFAIGLGGSADFWSGDFSGFEKKVNTGEIVMIAGGLTALSSIPFFIAAGKNRKKAINLSTGMQEIPVPQENGFVSRSVPSLTLKIQL